jgi:hypothetical protein
MERHGEAKLTDLLQKLANCPKVLPASITTGASLGGVLAALPLAAARAGVSALQGRRAWKRPSARLDR